MSLQSIANNKAKRLALVAMVWALIQIITGYAITLLRGSALVVCALSAVVTLVLWLLLPWLRRNSKSKTISLRFYMFIRWSVLGAFVCGFILPLVFGYLTGDKIKLAVVVFLGISSFFSVVLASNLYGKSVSEYLDRHGHLNETL